MTRVSATLPAKYFSYLVRHRESELQVSDAVSLVWRFGIKMKSLVFEPIYCSVLGGQKLIQ